MRNDGRHADQLRPIKMTPDFMPEAEGSVLIEIGKTRVICTATVDDGVPAFLKGSGKGWVTGEYGMLPRATEQRTPRESTRGKQSGRTLEIARLIQPLRAITDQKKLGERTVWLDCDVIQADGGTRTASITGAYVALALAIERIVAAGMLKVRALRLDSVCRPPASGCERRPDARPLLRRRLPGGSGYERGDDRQRPISSRFKPLPKDTRSQAAKLQDLLALAATGIRRLSDAQREVLPASFLNRKR